MELLKRFVESSITKFVTFFGKLNVKKTCNFSNIIYIKTGKITMNRLTDFKPITIADLFKPTDLFLTVSDRIKLYVHNQLLDFLKENKISEKRWLKRGVIQTLPSELSGQSYVFYYKTWGKKLKRKVTIRYDFIINN